MTVLIMANTIVFSIALTTVTSSAKKTYTSCAIPTVISSAKKNDITIAKTAATIIVNKLLAGFQRQLL